MFDKNNFKKLTISPFFLIPLELTILRLIPVHAPTNKSSIHLLKRWGHHFVYNLLDAVGPRTSPNQIIWPDTCFFHNTFLTLFITSTLCLKSPLTFQAWEVFYYTMTYKLICTAIPLLILFLSINWQIKITFFCRIWFTSKICWNNWYVAQRGQSSSNFVPLLSK